MTIDECIESLDVLLHCVDDKIQCERDKITKLVELKPSSFVFVLSETIDILEQVKQEMNGRGDNMYWISDGRRKAQRFMCDRCKEIVYDNAHGACRYPICPFCGVTKKGTRMRIDEYPFYVDVAKVVR